MDYWFYNTDAKAFSGQTATELLFQRGYAVTGGPQKFGDLLGRLSPGETLLMYENRVGILGVGIALESWDEIAQHDPWYYDLDEHEFRIRVDWYLDFRESPIEYNLLREAIGYVPRGALQRVLLRHQEIEDLIAKYFQKSKVTKKGRKKPSREECITQRIVRDSGLARMVKILHKYRCQICGERIAKPDGSYYAEGHHVRPLGGPYDGEDVMENIMCVCPNHHAELDHLAKRIDLNKLRSARNHDLDTAAILHHNHRCDTASLRK